LDSKHESHPECQAKYSSLGSNGFQNRKFFHDKKNSGHPTTSKKPCQRKSKDDQKTPSRALPPLFQKEDQPFSHKKEEIPNKETKSQYVNQMAAPARLS
jgi:hypothetical protein